uniref:glutathione transferase n=1 Tax=Branchiostoma floridae TaxID=7739 RepID=C3Z5F2_BRAFL|eukprot:XP_002596053.1 hypothetical protein BRAFLDRAFT_66215 [Branchiostoma floridae]
MAPSAPPKVKLTYFDFRGRAEPIRLLLEAGGVKYEFNGISQEEWKNLKPMAITGGLPILEINDKPLGESLAIGRFVARKNDMTGADDFDAACCDMIVDNVNEIFFSKMAPVMFMPEEERKYDPKLTPGRPAILISVGACNATNRQLQYPPAGPPCRGARYIQSVANMEHPTHASTQALCRNFPKNVLARELQIN